MPDKPNPDQRRAHSIAGHSGDMEEQWREARTRLNKHILKLIFSHLGESEELDNTIKTFKTSIRNAGSEEQRNTLIEEAINDVLDYTDARDLARKQDAGDKPELFLELLSKLALSHEQADEFIRLKDRVRSLKAQQDHLEIVNETIHLLTVGSEPGSPCNREPVLNLIEYIRLPAEAAGELENIKQKIHRSKDSADLVNLVKNISEIINQSSEKLQHEFREIRQYISGIVGQLGELNSYITGSINDHKQAFTDSRNLKKDFLMRNESLQMKIDSTSDIEEIKTCVNAHISTVNENLKAHIEMESRQHAKSEQRLMAMRRELNGMQKHCNTLEKKLVTARKEAMHDVLTGLPNRLAFNERFADEVQRYRRNRYPLTLAVLDIDHFKSVNDTWGHKAGDKVLKAVAEVCGNNIRSGDFLARFGGEEFVLLLPDTRLDQALKALENLRGIIEECHFHYSDQSVPITVSIGVAEFNGEDSTETVFKRADAALYAAKSAGRNRCKTEQCLQSAA